MRLMPADMLSNLLPLLWLRASTGTLPNYLHEQRFLLVRTSWMDRVGTPIDSEPFGCSDSCSAPMYPFHSGHPGLAYSRKGLRVPFYFRGTTRGGTGELLAASARFEFVDFGLRDQSHVIAELVSRCQSAAIHLFERSPARSAFCNTGGPRPPSSNIGALPLKYGVSFDLRS